MKARIYVRVARRRQWHAGERYKIDASHVQNQHPLEVSGKPLRTLHFAVDVQIPDSLFDEPTIPVVTVEVEADGTYRVDPIVVEQAPVEIEATT